jgi:hypothetical protein
MAAAGAENDGFKTRPEMDAGLPPRALGGGLATLAAAASDPVAPSWLRKLRRDKAMGTLLLPMKRLLGRMILTLPLREGKYFLAFLG